MKIAIFLSVFLWLSAALGGVYYLAEYANTSAAGSVVYPSEFPSASRIEKDATRPTLIFFAHPKCPCTHASLQELSRLLTDVNGKVKVYIVFDQPAGESPEWTETNLRSIAESLPNVKVILDEDERETNLFNAQTSGLVLLYDQDGKLRYNGGITASRGHEGDNDGKQALYELISHTSENNSQTAVFGCPLHNRECQGELINHDK